MTMLDEGDHSLENPTVGDMLVTSKSLNISGPDGKVHVLPKGTLGSIVAVFEFPKVTMTFISNNRPLIINLPVTVLLPHRH